jgi:hypothetical protein
MNETTALTRRPGYNVYEVTDRQISSYRKVLDSGKVNGGQPLYHVAFNNPRTTGPLAAAPEINAAVSGPVVTITWPPAPAGQMEIHRRVDAADLPWMLIGTVPASQGSFPDPASSEGVAYSYRGRVKTAEGFTGFSPAAAALVGEVKPPAVKAK